jgi:hypothetical protein
MVLGMCKNIGCTPDHVLYEMTYENLIMYGYATPVYDPDDKNDWDESIDANNPELARKISHGEGKVTNPFI